MSAPTFFAAAHREVRRLRRTRRVDRDVRIALVRREIGRANATKRGGFETYDGLPLRRAARSGG